MIFFICFWGSWMILMGCLEIEKWVKIFKLENFVGSCIWLNVYRYDFFYKHLIWIGYRGRVRGVWRLAIVGEVMLNSSHPIRISNLEARCARGFTIPWFFKWGKKFWGSLLIMHLRKNIVIFIKQTWSWYPSSNPVLKTVSVTHSVAVIVTIKNKLK